MPRIAYVNGRYIRHSDAMVHVEDRGYQLADGVYEVCEIVRGFILDMTGHLDRLDRSLRELRMDWPLNRSVLEQILRQVALRNHVRDGLVYIQVTRGVAPRDHAFPTKPVRPALVVTAKRTNPKAGAHKAQKGISVITVPENRWDRVDIKTIGLLPNVLARQAAVDAGAQEAWFVDADGTVTEGASTNAWIVTKDGTLVTRPAEHGILKGITRATVIRIAAQLDLKVEERGFSVEEAQGAREAFVTSATSEVTPVISVDGVSVANGHPGTVATSLREAFFAIAEKSPTC